MSRVHKALIALSLALIGVFGLAGVASADNYVPPTAPATTVVVSDTTSAVVPPPAGSGGSLAYTGSGLDVGATVGIAALILIVGIALVIAGTRITRRNAAHKG